MRKTEEKKKKKECYFNFKVVFKSEVALSFSMFSSDKTNVKKW